MKRAMIGDGGQAVGTKGRRIVCTEESAKKEICATVPKERQRQERNVSVPAEKDGVANTAEPDSRTKGN